MSLFSTTRSAVIFRFDKQIRDMNNSMHITELFAGKTARKCHDKKSKCMTKLNAAYYVYSVAIENVTYMNWSGRDKNTRL